jgi:hypothetical protein
MMEIVATAEVQCAPERLFVEVADLSLYPNWMRLVHRAVPIDDASTPAWDVELRAQVGPLNRSKRLRMERTTLIADRLVVFERAEADGREHAAWILRVEIVGSGAGSGSDRSTPESLVAGPQGSGELAHLTMTLSYTGSLFTAAGLRPVLDREIRDARERLVSLFAPTR